MDLLLDMVEGGGGQLRYVLPAPIELRQFIESLSVHDLRPIEPLRYRRVLQEDEESRIWQRLGQAWGGSPPKCAGTRSLGLGHHWR